MSTVHRSTMDSRLRLTAPRPSGPGPCPILRHAFSDAFRLTNFGYPHVRAAGLHGDT